MLRLLSNTGLFVIMAGILMTACENEEEQDKQPASESTLIDGQFDNYVGDMYLIRQDDIIKQLETIIDTIQTDDQGRFNHTFGNFVPCFYKLMIPGHETITLVIDHDQHVLIKGNVDSPDIKGSEDTDLWNRYEQQRKHLLETLVYPIREEIAALKRKTGTLDEARIEALTRKEIEADAVYRDGLTQFVRSDLSNSIAVYGSILRWSGDHNIALYDSLSAVFNSRPDTIIKQRIAEKVEALKRIQLGAMAPAIETVSSDGRTLRLYDNLGAKCTLIDFWASWCGPCRQEAKSLLRLYKLHHNDGFEIFGVSLDNRRELWTKAIEKDARIWVNGSRLLKFQAQSAIDYSVTSLPFNVLVDDEGRIIARNLQGAELEKQVQNIIQ